MRSSVHTGPSSGASQSRRALSPARGVRRWPRLMVLFTVLGLHAALLFMLLAIAGEPIRTAVRPLLVCCIAMTPLRRELETPLPKRHEPRTRPLQRSATVARIPPARTLQSPEPPRAVTDSVLNWHLPESVLNATEAEPESTWVFDRKLARRLDAVRKARHNAEARQHGLSADVYAHASALGERIKTSAGCFELREDTDTGHTRWWREACRDGHDAGDE